MGIINWQSVVDTRTRVEAQRKEAQMNAQIGVRSIPLVGGTLSSIKESFHGITKYPRMLFAGLTGTGKGGDHTVDMPEVPKIFEGTDLHNDLIRKRDEAQKSIDEKKKAYTRLFVDNDDGFFTRWSEYKKYKSVSQHNDFRESLTVPVKASLAVTALGALATGAVKGISRSMLDHSADSVSVASLGGLAPGNFIGSAMESLGSYLS